ncbi:MAG: hypothetical protein A2Y61_00675 [Chloroflexi bacterium RBG_13_60_13]|nr:MAG: hypothetical protein A2Y61_00675 [Chloroflexi bacterium RBG_13_60_13]
MKQDTSPEERLARVILAGHDAESVGELAWEDSTWRSMPTDAQLIERVSRALLEPEILRGSERVSRWLMALAWSRIDRAELGAAVREQVKRRFLVAVRRYVGRELASEGLAQTKPAERQHGSPELAAVLEGIATLERESPGSLHSFRKLRQLVHLAPLAFDRAVMALARARRIIVHEHDYPAGLTDDERGWYVRDGARWYVGAGAITEGSP